MTPDQKTAADVNTTLFAVGTELRAAMERFPPMNSAHEAWGVLSEEMDELWDEIKAKQGDRSGELMRKEAIQVAAMAVRLVVDVVETGRWNL